MENSKCMGHTLLNRCELLCCFDTNTTKSSNVESA
jgi:hypothetical protein